MLPVVGVFIVPSESITEAGSKERGIPLVVSFTFLVGLCKRFSLLVDFTELQ